MMRPLISVSFWGSFLLSSIAYAQSQTGDTATAARTAMACHQSFKDHAPKGRYEVWQKDEMIFARSIASDPSVAGRDGTTYLQLSFTDGNKVFAAKVPSPSSKDSSGKDRQKFYYADHNFKLNFPGGKSYCVSIKPQLGTDEMKRYENSPPAQCAADPAIAVTEVKDTEAQRHLDNIHTRMSDALGLSLHLSERCKAEGRCDRERPEARLVGFSGGACRAINYLRSDLRRLDAYAAKYGSSNEGVATDGARAGDGVQ